MNSETKKPVWPILLAAGCCLVGSFLSGIAAVHGMAFAGGTLPNPGSFDLGPLFYFVGGFIGGLFVSSISSLALAFKFGRESGCVFLSSLVLTPVLAGIVSALIFLSSR